MSDRINREFALNILQTEPKSLALLTVLSKNSDIKKAMKFLWLETCDDSIRSDLIQKHPNITMYFFVEAMSTRDFKQLKALLPHLYNLTIDNLLTAYSEVGIRKEVFNLEKKAWAVKKSLESCQKDLINKTRYDANDVWLLVMLSLIHPYASILPTFIEQFLTNYKLARS